MLAPALTLPDSLRGSIPAQQKRKVVKRECEDGMFAAVRDERQGSRIHVDELRGEVETLLFPRTEGTSTQMVQPALIYDACCGNAAAQDIILNALRQAVVETNWHELWVLLGQIGIWMQQGVPRMQGDGCELPWWVRQARAQASPSGISEVVVLREDEVIVLEASESSSTSPAKHQAAGDAARPMRPIKRERQEVDDIGPLPEQWEDLDRRVNTQWFGGPNQSASSMNGIALNDLPIDQLRRDCMLADALMLRAWKARDTADLRRIVAKSKTQKEKHPGAEHWNTGIKARVKLAEALEDDEKFGEALPLYQLNFQLAKAADGAAWQQPYLANITHDHKELCEKRIARVEDGESPYGDRPNPYFEDASGSF
jgi:hypothetical protein